MARRLELKPRQIRPTTQYVVSEGHIPSARLGYEYVLGRPELDVRKVQLQDTGNKTCWYVSLNENIDVQLFNFTITRSTLQIEFPRLPHLLPFLQPDDRKKFGIQNQSCLSKRVSSSMTSIPSEIVSIMDDYVSRCREANGDKKLKQGGTSTAETIVEGLLTQIGVSFVKGTRPEWLVGIKGKYLQLDFLMQELGIAIEVQGIQHEKDIYGDQEGHESLKKNDAQKADSCIQNGVSLIRMNAQTIQTKLVRMQVIDQNAIMKGLLASAKATGKPVVIDWVL